MPQLIRSVVFLILLASCAVESTESPAFRDPEAPIYSSAVLDIGRLAGHWVQVATFAADDQAACQPGVVDIAAGQASWDLCLAAGPVRGAGPMLAEKPGRFDLEGMPVWWVLWADADYRTLVIGTPSGRMGFVLNRDAALPADRVKAVRDVLNFNGYHLDQLTEF